MPGVDSWTLSCLLVIGSSRTDVNVSLSRPRVCAEHMLQLQLCIRVDNPVHMFCSLGSNKRKL